MLRLVPLTCMPSPLPRQVRWNLSARTVPPSSPFPGFKAGRPLHQPFRGLLSVYSRYGLHARRVALRPSYTEGSSSFLTSTAASVATGRSEPVPGRDFHPLWTSAFHGALESIGLGQRRGRLRPLQLQVQKQPASRRHPRAQNEEPSKMNRCIDQADLDPPVCGARFGAVAGNSWIGLPKPLGGKDLRIETRLYEIVPHCLGAPLGKL